MSKNIAKRIVQKVTTSLGYEIRKKEEHRSSNFHPCTYRYFCREASGLFELPLEKGRSGCHFFWGNEDAFEAAVKAALQCSDSATKEAIRAVLISSLILPNNAAARIGLNDKEVPQLACEPGWVYLLPWEARTIEQRKREIDFIVKTENERYGLRKNASEGAVWGDEDKIDIEARRLNDLLQSIKLHGYECSLQDDGAINATICVANNGSWVWLITAGNHRFAVLKALKYQLVHVHINSWVYRSDAEYWPGVISGTFSKQSALKLFDNLVGQ